MAEREDTYWWHLGRLRIIQSYVQRVKKNRKDFSILNVGCGTGGTIDFLEGLGETNNVDVSDDAINYAKSRGYKKITKVDGIKLPFKSKTYDMVGAFDVLEHIDKQVEALKEWKRVIKDDGSIVITVPAYKWLWSNHDVSLHHMRRYTTKSLTKVSKEAGLRTDKISYAIVFSLPLIVGFRFSEKFLRSNPKSESSYVNVPGWLNKAFTKFLYLEAKLHKIISFPVGTTVVAVLKKD